MVSACCCLCKIGCCLVCHYDTLMPVLLVVCSSDSHCGMAVAQQCACMLPTSYAPGDRCGLIAGASSRLRQQNSTGVSLSDAQVLRSRVCLQARLALQPVGCCCCPLLLAHLRLSQHVSVLAPQSSQQAGIAFVDVLFMSIMRSACCVLLICHGGCYLRCFFDLFAWR